jgi:FkbM family methyltransferase
VKQAIRTLLARGGYEIRKSRTVPAGSDTRPIGDLTSFFEDIRARGFKIKCAADCGANAGKWSRALLDVYPHAQVVMVEAQESMRPHLQSVVDEFPEARIHIGGVGREKSEKLFTYWPDPTGSTFLDREDPKAQSEGRQVNLAIDTLPAILEKAGAPVPDLVKMDIQGFELEALEGMASILSQVGALILESNLFAFLPGQPQANVLVTWLAHRGFFLYDICGYGRRPTDGAVSHVDMVFANDKGFLRRYQGW